MVSDGGIVMEIDENFLIETNKKNSLKRKEKNWQ
jgi:hypothetical protein